MWGRGDPRYARNEVVRRAFEALGWQVRGFRPAVSALGDAEARLRRVGAADLLWVPCFRQRDVAAAARFARTTRTPLVADPLISAYDKQVGERRKHPAGGLRAERLRRWEGGLLRRADRVVADTASHARYFCEVLGVAPGRVFVVPVGADETLFRPAPLPQTGGGVEALFYGSFLALHGPEVVVAAARLAAQPRLRITLLGSGPLLARCRAAAGGEPRLRFEPWIDYAALPQRIHRAHLLLGVFGVTPKSQRVIPNKVYQALACARPVITRRAEAYPAPLLDVAQDGIRFVPPGDPPALARALDALCADPQRLAAAARAARASYERWFSARSVERSLEALLDSLGLDARPDPGPAPCPPGPGP